MTALSFCRRSQTRFSVLRALKGKVQLCTAVAPSVFSPICRVLMPRTNGILGNIDPVVTAAEFLYFAKMEEDIEKLWFNLVFLAIFVNNMNFQSEPPFHFSDCAVVRFAETSGKRESANYSGNEGGRTMGNLLTAGREQGSVTATESGTACDELDVVWCI